MLHIWVLVLFGLCISGFASGKSSSASRRTKGVHGGDKARKVDIVGDEVPPLLGTSSRSTSVEIITFEGSNNLIIRKCDNTDLYFDISSTEKAQWGARGGADGMITSLRITDHSSNNKDDKSKSKKNSINSQQLQRDLQTKKHTIEKYDGLFGVYKLPSGYYLALIAGSASIETDPSKKGAFPEESQVREIQKISLLKVPLLASSSTTSTAIAAAAKDDKQDREAAELLLHTLSRHSLYFSSISSGSSNPEFFDVTRHTQSRVRRRRGCTHQMEADVIPRLEGTFESVLEFILYLYVCSYVRHFYSILFYCYVTTLTPLYVRPLNPQTTNILF